MVGSDQVLAVQSILNVLIVEVMLSKSVFGHKSSCDAPDWRPGRWRTSQNARGLAPFGADMRIIACSNHRVITFQYRNRRVIVFANDNART